MKIKGTLILCFMVWASFAQEVFHKSIHQEESEYYKSLGLKTTAQFDSLNNLIYGRTSGQGQGRTTDYRLSAEDSPLAYTVFGYHPYWTGSAYFDYQWNLLSDLCFFSYEVDPSTGDPITVHEWLTSPVIDSAQAHDVNVHLCVTLFSGHSTFFSDTSAQNNLIQNLIWYVGQRNADGINIDFEAVSSSLAGVYMDFLVKLSEEFHAAIPGSVVSIAMPAVDWSGMYDLGLLRDYIDLFMVMGYDYYWNGSTQAGPIAPLYAFTGSFNYSLSRTLSYYQYEQVPEDKLVLGLPYYGRRWPTVSNTIPSNTTGQGTAYRYATIKNNSSGYYTPENHYWDTVSFSGCYIYNNQGWYQCFLEEVYGLGKRYDIVKQRKWAGIGIWALGYDQGYTELWELIQEKFTHGWNLPTDTLYDSGGPEWNYYNDENYTLTISAESMMNLGLYFLAFDLEPGYDSLFIFDGQDTNATLIGGYSGNNLPPFIESTSPWLTFHFKSDVGETHMGWEAIYYELPFGNEELANEPLSFKIYPNPAHDGFHIQMPEILQGVYNFQLIHNSGQLMMEGSSTTGANSQTYIDVGGLPSGLYLLKINDGAGRGMVKKVVVH